MNDTKTFLLLKPDAVQRGLVFDIVGYFGNYGFSIIALDAVEADVSRTLSHYSEIIERMGAEFSQRLLGYFPGNLVVPIVLYREQGDAIEACRRMIGATDPSKAQAGTIRGDLGQDSIEKCTAEKRACRNLVHASDSPESVRREIAIWLPKYIKKPLDI